MFGQIRSPCMSLKTHVNMTVTDLVFVSALQILHLEDSQDDRLLVRNGFNSRISPPNLPRRLLGQILSTPSTISLSTSFFPTRAC